MRTYSPDNDLVNERRDLITREAAKLFVRQGYGKTTMREIAKACGLQAGSLYHYIGGKSDIITLILDTQPELVQSMETLIKQLEGCTYKEVLEKVIEKHLSLCEEAQDMIIFTLRVVASLTSAQRQRLLQGLIGYCHLFEKVIIEGVEAGEFHTEDPFWAALTIHELGITWAFMRSLVRENYTFEEYVKKLTETAFRLLGVDTC